jgi:hypothetical protein
MTELYLLLINLQRQARDVRASVARQPAKPEPELPEIKYALLGRHGRDAEPAHRQRPARLPKRADAAA